MLWGSPGECILMKRPTQKLKNRIIIFPCTICNLCFYSQNHISLTLSRREAYSAISQACFLPPTGERITGIIHIIWSKNNFSTGHWNYCSRVAGKTNSKCYHPPCHAKMSYCKPHTPSLWNDVLGLQFYYCYYWSTKRYKIFTLVDDFHLPGCKLEDVFFSAWGIYDLCT
jgi:hypothetical protein